MLKIAKKYFESWSKKNLNELSSFLHDDCVLEDWENSIDGKIEILDFNKKFFFENNVSLKINEIYENRNNVWAHLTITLNNTEVLEVIDVLNFKNDKIIKIKAFKG